LAWGEITFGLVDVKGGKWLTSNVLFQAMVHRPEILVAGGGLGGCAAALAACSLGATVVLTESTAWIGGQLTSQCVPPDEHPWIETFGSTERYRFFRDQVRWYYADHYDLAWAAGAMERLNPGGAWVSALSHEPRVALTILRSMMQPFTTSGRLTVLEHCEPVRAEVDGDQVVGVWFSCVDGDEFEVRPRWVLDATELGDLLPLTGTEYRTGAEAREQTGEPHAKEVAEPENQQALTWCLVMANDPRGNHVIDKPELYDEWRRYQPSFWPGPLIGWDDLHPWTNKPRRLQLFPDGEAGTPMFTYRRIVCAGHHRSGVRHDATVMNWPLNDYFERPIVDRPKAEVAESLWRAKQLSLSVLYWLQTVEGHSGLYLCPHLTGTPDGLAMAPYIRESRRILALTTICEQDVTPGVHHGRLGRRYADSVGVGYYRIDLHPSTGGDSYLDISSVPFQIPLGALIPRQTRNLLAACKSLGTTHITNGCYRLHPVEWNIGESAGLLAAWCGRESLEPHQVAESPSLTDRFRRLLTEQGIELEWPEHVEAPN
jgi:hypothetical protein